MPDTTTPRKLYAIMRYAKIKSFAALDRVCQHNIRTIAGENIRDDAPPPLELLEEGSDDFVASARGRLRDLGIDMQSTKDKVIAVETVTTASKAWFDKASEAEKQEWLRTNVEWAKKKFGKGLLSAKLHLDEEVWHIHFVAIPVVEKRALPRGKKPTDPVKLADYERRKAEAPMKWTLSYHDILGGKNQRLSEEQDAYHAAVKHLGLERGEVQRDDIEIELGDELTISALELSRGRNADGSARPRRSMTPAEGRAAVKRLRAEAEALVHAAEEDRKQAATDRAALAAAQAEAERQAQDVAHELRMAAERHENADAAARDAERERNRLSEARQIADQQRQKLEEDRRALGNALARAEEDHVVLQRARHEAQDVARRAEQERQAAAAERDAIARDREALAQDQAALKAQQKRQDAEIELLARGADDSNGLDLRPHEQAFTMKADVMTEKEKLVYKTPWTAGALRIGHQLALALQRIRRLTADLLRREGRMMVQEKELARREAATIERDRQQAISAQRLEQRHAEQDAAMALARDQLAKREQVIAARENALEPREAAIQQQASAAREIEAAAEEREQAQRDWMKVVIGSADGSLIGSLRDDGYFHMARQIDGRPRPASDAVKRTIAIARLNGRQRYLN
ncbi:plasmid recombination protein [Sphingobium sp. JS3065]|uniref:plasmid recombination protein n=1 Tax=Sphingobium sp. JS3065 TaxID=2970925 RepID=UPI0022652761|nr:plasmid recombination protein [Sphingobium sp. JS3065]UZW57558.1 plasmid recombination protein [Sphingobium sp. JS3065]